MSILRGKVVSGKGNFSYWIEKLNDHYLRKTGMRPFPGTLNVQLEEPYTLPGTVIRLEPMRMKRAGDITPERLLKLPPTFDSAIIFISVTAR